jgi:predicted ferric reductase
MFGGLDRQYIVHRLTGRASVMFMLLHPIFLLIHSSFSLETLKVYLVPGFEWSVSLGTISFAVACLLISITLLIRLPYHIWHITHRFMVLVLILAFVHTVLAGSDVKAHPTMMGVLSLFFAAGVISNIYTAFLYRPLNARTLPVRSARTFSDILELVIERPEGFHFEPGQFVFVQFSGVNRSEYFPFSISSDRYEDHIRLSIRASGDTTRKLSGNIQRGDKVRIIGPYGKFGKRYMSHDRDMVWVAGGIGITPFLSMAMNESVHPTGRNIDLFYVMRTHKDAHYDHELMRESSRNRHLRYRHWLSDVSGRITAEDISMLLGPGERLRDRVILLCGPPPMMEDLSRQFRKLGVPAKNIIYEDFNLLGH